MSLLGLDYIRWPFVSQLIELGLIKGPTVAHKISYNKKIDICIFSPPNLQSHILKGQKRS